jgi:large subunit ribosomal protein L31
MAGTALAFVLNLWYPCRQLVIRYRGIIMQAEIHPNYKEVEVKCSCGYVTQIRSTMPNATLAIEVCSQCHPFYTGKQKIVDTAGGRVDKFKRRFKKETNDGKAEA